MPTKALPKKLVKQLRVLAPKIRARFHLLPNHDHRSPGNPRRNPAFVDTSGNRVRVVSYYTKSTPNSGPRRRSVVFKYSQYANHLGARYEINEIRRRVREINRRPNPHFIMLMPKAHAISRELVAMKEVNFPASYEVGLGVTPRGIIVRNRLNKLGISTEQINTAINRAVEAMDVEALNLMILGAKNGKVVFMPLIDLQ